MYLTFAIILYFVHFNKVNKFLNNTTVKSREMCVLLYHGSLTFYIYLTDTAIFNMLFNFIKPLADILFLSGQSFTERPVFGFRYDSVDELRLEMFLDFISTAPD